VRNEDGELVPTKLTAAAATYWYKLQDPALLSARARFEKRMPELGHGAARLLLSKAARKRGETARRAVMLAGPTMIWPDSLRSSTCIGCQVHERGTVRVERLCVHWLS
jgi:hypothetical protein